jgi:riboflavin biosynthesis pyrimidine reductase
VTRRAGARAARNSRDTVVSHMPDHQVQAPEYLGTTTWDAAEPRIAAIVARALAAQAAAPVLVTDQAAAQAIDASPQMMARLAAQGAPHVILGDRRRWNIAKLVEWLEARNAGGEP